MKPIKLTAIILLLAIIISGVITISALVGRHNKSVSKSPLPLPAKVAKPRPNVHIARMAAVPMTDSNSTAKPMEFAAHYKQLPDRLAQKAIAKNTFVQPNVSQRRNSPYRGLIMPEQMQNNRAMPQSPENKRHAELFAQVEPYMRVPYSKDAILRMNAELISKLPDNYGKMVTELDNLKQKELIARQTQTAMVTPITNKAQLQMTKDGQPAKPAEAQLYQFDNSNGKVRIKPE